MATMHYAYGAPASAAIADGFNLIDLQYASSVNALPDGTKALIYLNEGSGVTQSFIDKVTPLLGNSKVFGFYLTDEPDPTGKYHTQVTAANLKAESDWIHSHFPGAKTFITLMEMGTFYNSDYTNTYNPANTGIDYYGINPYPVRSTVVDFNYIDRAVAAAEKAGIPQSAIVPVYQAFGGGGWATNTGGSYVMPTTAQEQTIIDHFAKLVPSPAFDMVYKWSSQNGETSLGNTPSMQAFYLDHNTHTSTSTSSGSGTGTGTSTGTTTPPPVTTTTADIKGTSGNDILRPADNAAHTMAGYAGNDDYYVNNAATKVIEAAGQGQDRVWTSVSYALTPGSSIEVLGTQKDAGTTAINLTGNELAQHIIGNAGNNIINGGGGADTLTGNGGNDTFVFNTAPSKGVVTITDFNPALDKIQLDHGIFQGLSTGALASTAFYTGTAAHDSTDHIVYNSTTGALYFDSDGIGGASQIQFASLTPHLAITANSFAVV
ncbi:calcium-binding protein [Mesorhizobium sp. VK25A]|uniref:Calcium-binding protein n=1 Tax=Mesorhizobium vachelliae TaxID=3072309 RepID=A0ABU5AAA0_9HYPH|nr:MULTISPECIES: calcium-binding protein [unclassified Mesorhizobium]MDX8534097.1 calcium-binding protein [Mesorhizobium sp. VK25D]MDX8548392.1 calcium-binding protein [Mesorhizobium sp. VK25A]